MDPSIMKLLEEDEDETMHSGADVEAFTAALNRDIEGDISISQPSDSDNRSSCTSNQFLSQWETSSHDENTNSTSQQDTLAIDRSQPQAAEMDIKQDGSLLENQKPQDDSMQELNHFSVQHKDDSFEQQAEQNMLIVSQAMNMQGTENILTHDQGPDRTQNPEHESLLVNLQNMNIQQPSMTGTINQQGVASAMGNQQVMATGSSNQQGINRSRKIVPFAMLLPVIQPQLDKDRAMQLSTLYLKLRKNEIAKDGFVRHMKSIVGDQMLKMAVYKLQSQAARNSQNLSSQLPTQSQAGALHQQLPTPSTSQMIEDLRSHMADNNALKSLDVECQPDSHGVQVSQVSTSTAKAQDRERSSFQPQGINKPHSPHVHFSQPSFPAYGGNTTQGMNVSSMTQFDRQNLGDPKRVDGATLPHVTNNSTASQNAAQWQPSSSKEQKNGVPSPMTRVKQEPLDQSNEQFKSRFSAAHGLLTSVHAEQASALPGTLKDESVEMQSSRMGFSTPTSLLPPNSMSSSISTQIDPSSLNSQIPSATSPVALGNNAKAVPKKPAVGQKKPLEALGSPPPSSSKKPKVSGAFLDQSIEQLNDVTAVSGVNLREEEEQLFSGAKEDSHVSEASRRVVQEEEERLVLEKIPLQRKLAEIMAKNGLKGISNDVEHCLSLCVEERLHGLLGNLIRLSKQRLDVEKHRHKTIITSDVRQQIMSMNHKAKEELDKRQAEAEKLQRLNEPEGNLAVDGEKDDVRAKLVKANKEEDDKMRTTAANVAARAAVGGDDMLSKWQLMAEQARQKREGVIDVASASQPGKDVGRKLSSSRSTKDNQEAEKRGQSAATSSAEAIRKVGTNQVIVPHSKAARRISVKDVIAVLEREPQMSKSTLMYCLYEKVRGDAAAK